MNERIREFIDSRRALRWAREDWRMVRRGFAKGTHDFELMEQKDKALLAAARKEKKARRALIFRITQGTRKPNG